MAYRYERTLREGAVYRFHTEPFDPVDAFRGGTWRSVCDW
jgi:hypothetical protein